MPVNFREHLYISPEKAVRIMQVPEKQAPTVFLDKRIRRLKFNVVLLFFSSFANSIDNGRRWCGGR